MQWINFCSSLEETWAWKIVVDIQNDNDLFLKQGKRGWTRKGMEDGKEVGQGKVQVFMYIITTCVESSLVELKFTNYLLFKFC